MTLKEYNSVASSLAVTCFIDNDVAFGNAEVSKELPYFPHVSCKGQSSYFYALVAVFFVNVV